MIVAGLVITVAGFLIAVGSLGATTSTTVRLVMVLAGIGVSLVGILGVLNAHYLKNANWKQ
jgi:cytochrome c biogenesis protein CcdA